MPATILRPTQTQITTPFELYAFFLERLGEAEPKIHVDRRSLERFHETLHRVRELKGEYIRASFIMRRFYLKVVSPSAANAVSCGRDLQQHLESTANFYWNGRRDARVSIESSVILAYESFGDLEDRLLRCNYTTETIRIRSRRALEKRYGVTIDVEMDNDCLLA